MDDPDTIEENTPLLRRKVLWFIISVFVCVLVFLLIRSLTPNQLTGGNVRLSGAYGPATFENGFDLNAIGIQPSERPPTSSHAKITGKSYTDDKAGKSYFVLAMKHDRSKRDLIFLFNTVRSRNMLTSEHDKKYGGDVILSPIALINWRDFQNLESGELRFADIEPTGFPVDCVFRATVGTNMSLSHSYRSNSSCYSDESTMTISGRFKRRYGSLLVDVTIRIEDDQFWFGEEGQIGKRYSEFGTAIGPIDLESKSNGK